MYFYPIEFHGIKQVYLSNPLYDKNYLLSVYLWLKDQKDFRGFRNYRD